MSIRLRTELREGVCTVRALIKHPMEPERVAKDGTRTPAHFIKELVFDLNGERLVTAQWGPGVSKNPYVSFIFEGAKIGDVMSVSWVDNRGERDSLEQAISAGAPASPGAGDA